MFTTTSKRPFALHLRLPPAQPTASPSPPESPVPLALPQFPSPDSTAYKPHLATGYVGGHASTFADGLGLKENHGEKHEEKDEDEDKDEVDTWPFDCAAASRGTLVGAAMLMPDTDEGEGGIALGIAGESTGHRDGHSHSNGHGTAGTAHTATQAYSQGQADHMAGLIAEYDARKGDVLQPRARPTSAVAEGEAKEEKEKEKKKTKCSYCGHTPP